MAGFERCCLLKWFHQPRKYVFKPQPSLSTLSPSSWRSQPACVCAGGRECLHSGWTRRDRPTCHSQQPDCHKHHHHDTSYSPQQKIVLFLPLSFIVTFNVTTTLKLFFFGTAGALVVVTVYGVSPIHPFTPIFAQKPIKRYSNSAPNLITICIGIHTTL